jgi:dTDP-3-amino-3,4,6-trideoxy-alpha-D-glucose transaminase
MVNLKPALEATAPCWRANIERMFQQMRFISGEQCALFEQEFAASQQARFAVGVGSGTSAIELSLRVAGIVERSQEVITPALTSPFTALAILAAGGTPRFADVDSESLLLDPGDVEHRVTRKTAAIIPVHLYGSLCDLDGLVALNRRLQAVIVQDACQAHGSRLRKRSLAEFSACVAYSFYPTKNLGAMGDGGAVLTNRAVLAKRLRLLRDGGRKDDQVSRVAAVNSRLDEMQCCYLRAFLPHLENWNARRARIAEIYDEALAGCEGVRPVLRSPDSVNHLYVIRAGRRNRLREYLSRRGVATGVHYPVPLHLQPAFRDCGLTRGDLPRTEKACGEIVSLPLWPHMPQSAAWRVAELVRSFYL